MKYVLRAWFLMSICLAGSVMAEGRVRLAEFLDGLTTLQAGFTQSVMDTENNRADEFSGVFKLRRPGQFRWDYQAPYEQAIIADGRNLWIVDNDLEQVTRQNQKAVLKGTPAALLAEDIDLDAEFQVIDFGERQDMEWLELIPRGEESQFLRILLGFKENSLLQMEMTDKFGQLTRFRFFDVERNAMLSPEAFEFQEPLGFDMYIQ